MRKLAKIILELTCQSERLFRVDLSISEIHLLLMDPFIEEARLLLTHSPALHNCYRWIRSDECQSYNISTGYRFAVDLSILVFSERIRSRETIGLVFSQHRQAVCIDLGSVVMQ